MRTRKQELISNELKPIVSDLIKTNREKYNYSLEDLSKLLTTRKIDKPFTNTKQAN